MRTGLESLRATLQADRRQNRRRGFALLLAYLAAYVFLVCFRGWRYGFVPPGQAVRTIFTFFRIQFAKLFSLPLYARRGELTAFLPYYAEVIARFRKGFMMTAAGGILSLSGLIYQSATRNAMAVPTMLGVSSGVNLARVILVLQLGEAAYTLTRYHYYLCYGIPALALLVILAGGKLAGGRRASVADMLIVGTVVNRLMQMTVNYLRTTMDTDTLEIYQEFSEKSYDLYDSFQNLGIICLIAAVVLLPILFMRFRYNAVSFDDEDARTMGVRPAGLRIYGLAAGAILTTTAMIFCGNVGMIALIVPHLCRYLFGSEFSRLMGASAVTGGLLLLMGYILSNFIRFAEYVVPVGNVISLLAVPVLIWALLRQRRGWE